MELTKEQKFKRRAKQALIEKVPEIPKEALDGIVNDSWDWFEEHGHQGDMTETVWDKILKKHGVI